MRFYLSLLFLLGPTFIACTKEGGSWQHYRLSALDEARERNMTIYLHFIEDGKGVCERQREILDKLIRDPKFKKVGAYRVKWNDDKGVQNYFKIQEPCALLALKGKSEKGRGIATDDERLLLRLLDQAL